jgi:acyl-CoA thioester hydrolase
MHIRVYYEDTDCGNVVYYANYLKYMERGRTELMRERGVSFAQLHNEGILFVVSEVSVKYRASARYNDLLTIDTAIKEKTAASIVFGTVIKNEGGELLVTGDVKVACVGKDGKIMRIPKNVAKCLG